MGNWNQGGGGGGRGGSGAEVDANMGIDRGGSDDNDSFFSGTFDDPGEAGFSGPAYEGQYDGIGSDGTTFDNAVMQSGYSTYGFDYNQMTPASQIGIDTGMYGYANYAFQDFQSKTFPGAGDEQYDYFSTPSVTDLSLTSAQTREGYGVGTDSYNYGIPQLPASFYDSSNIFGMGGGLRQGIRTTERGAKAYGDYLGVDVTVMDPVTQYSGIRGVVQKGVNALTSRFGTTTLNNMVINPRSEFIGEVYDDRSGRDALVNAVFGFAVPGYATIDTALAVDATGRGMKAVEYGMSDTIFGKQEFAMPVDEYADMMAAKATEDALSRGSDGEYIGSPTPSGPTVPSAAVSASALRRRSILRAAFTPIVRDYMRQESAFGDATGLFGSFAFKEGGKVDLEDVKEKAKSGLTLSEMLKDPDKANTREELDEVYAFNGAVFEVFNEMEAMSAGGAAGDEISAEMGGPTGFVGQTPENVSEAATVADDVPLDVPEGTFVINAAAAEHAGSKDIKDMILDAIAEARRQGIDISTDGSKITEENAVSLLVSRGEVIIPPVLAKIIGYDRLNKINNRGKQEVEQRVAENGQSPEAEALDRPPQNPAEGSATMTASDGGVQVRNVQAQGNTFEDSVAKGKQASASAEIAGEGFAVRPQVRYSEANYTFGLPNGVVIDGRNKQVGMAIDGEVFLDDMSIRGGYSRDKQEQAEQGKYNGQVIGGGSSSSSQTRYSIGGSKGPVSLDVSTMDVGTVDKIRQGKFVYRYSDDGELFLEGDNQGMYRLGFLQRF